MEMKNLAVHIFCLRGLWHSQVFRRHLETRAKTSEGDAGLAS